MQSNNIPQTPSIKQDMENNNSIEIAENVSIAAYSEDDERIGRYDGDEEDDEENKFDEEAQGNTEKKLSVKEVLMLSFSSLGAIYGDLGTSPLYVLNSIKYPNEIPTKDDIYGGISLIFYIFVFIVLIKYALIVLVIGPNNGEGGQVAIYAKIARHLNIGPKGVEIPGAPVKNDLELLAREETNLSFISHNSLIKKTNEWKNHPKVIKTVSTVILICCFLGCSLVFSDGLLTPTTSILSAIAGIQLADPSFNAVLGVSEVVIIFLFMIQQFGSHKISFVFAPIILVWLAGLVVCGIYNIVNYDSGVFKALSPYYAIKLLKASGIDALSGAMLSITGTEAMFADLGHFGRLPTQIGIFFVFICLMICYLGQGAYIVEHPKQFTNPFYLSIPGGPNSWSYWIMFVLATISTIIASQALILGVFSIVSQLINLDCFPKFKVKHVSSSYAGKVYIPVVNFLLLIGVCCTAAGFKNSNNVTAAYGLGINLDFLVTSTLILICMVYVYEFNFIFPLMFALIFLPLEFALVISNLKKVPHGAWFPLMMAGLSFTFLTLWRYGRSKVFEEQMTSRVKLGDLFPSFKRKAPEEATFELRGRAMVKKDSDERDCGTDNESHDSEFGITLPKILKSDPTSLELSTRFGKSTLKKFNGVGLIYVDSPHQILSSPNTVPKIYERVVLNFQSLPSIMIFVTTRTLSIPSIPNEDRVLIGNMKVPGHYKCVVRFGFMEEIHIDNSLNDHILNIIPEMTGLKVLIGLNNEVPVVHIFENNEVRSHEYNSSGKKSKNPFVIIHHYMRRFYINSIFGPLDSLFRVSDKILPVQNEEDETASKLFIGGVIRI